MCCSLITRDVLVLNSDLMSFQMERCSIVMARTGYHGCSIPYLTIMRFFSSMSEVNSSSSSLIWERSVDVMELVFSSACRRLAFSRTDLLSSMFFK